MHDENTCVLGTHGHTWGTHTKRNKAKHNGHHVRGENAKTRQRAAYNLASGHRSLWDRMNSPSNSG